MLLNRKAFKGNNLWILAVRRLLFIARNRALQSGIAYVEIVHDRSGYSEGKKQEVHSVE